MSSFTLAPGSYQYRPLRRLADPMHGWDVVAVQTALVAVRRKAQAFPATGVFLDETAKAVWAFQAERGLVEDGIAGIGTQRKLGSILARRAQEEYELPGGVPYGHLEKECGFQLGNHTAPYPRDGSRDLGATQRNSKYATIEQAFDTPSSVDKLARQVRDYHAKYAKRGLSEQRAWELACGSWNAPAFTNWLAGIRDSSALEPSAASRVLLEDYIDAVTTYVSF